MKISFDGYELKIIWKLYRHKYYGGKHTSIDNLRKGFERKLGTEINNAIDKLVKNQIIIKEKKTKEDHVCLNVKNIKVINKALDWYAHNMNQIDKKHLEKIYFEVELE